MKAKFTIGVFGIIIDDNNRVLLCHRKDYDLWNLPGGALENTETPLEGVIREVKEETGLITEANLIGVYTKPQNNEIVFSFECKIKGGKITLNDEADKIEYFDLKNFPPNTSPKQVERIHDYFNWQSKTIFKIQQGKSSIELIKKGKL